MSQKDANGNPLYPHFDMVIDDVINIVQIQVDRGEPVDVKAAYDKACWMNDSVRLKLQRAGSEAERKAAEAQRKRDIEEARRAGLSVSGSGGASTDTPADTVRAELERLYDKHHS